MGMFKCVKWAISVNASASLCKLTFQRYLDPRAQSEPRLQKPQVTLEMYDKELSVEA